MEQQPMGKKDHVLAMSIIIAAFVIGGAFIYGSGSRPTPTANNREASQKAPSISNPTVDDDVILGDPKAPVTLLIFGDYQCPFCKKMFDETEGKIRDEYIASGKVNMVYRDFPLDKPNAQGQVLHPYARPAAEAAECARDQGKYWAYHDVLFDRQADIPTIDYVALAGELELNTATFKTCVDTRKYKDEVEKDYNDGIAAGISGTPGSFVLAKDGTVVQFIEGAYPYDTFKAALEKALAL